MVDAETEIRKCLNAESNGNYIFINCPFHDEKTPSCKVNLVPQGKWLTGSFFCFGCSAKGNWNDLATKLNLPTFNSKAFVEKKALVKFPDLEEEKTIKSDLATNQIIEWPKTENWRDYDGSVLHSVGCKLTFDKKSEVPILVFPVYIGKRYKGAVKAFMEKRKVSYLNTKGTWARDYGLLGYNQARATIREDKLSYVIVVEGPRDFLRLYCENLPVVALLGTQNISRKKLNLIMRLSDRLKYVITMFDGDNAGRKASKKIKDEWSAFVKIKKISIPSKSIEGKEVMCDPNDAEDGFIDQIKEVLSKKPYSN